MQKFKTYQFLTEFYFCWPVFAVNLEKYWYGHGTLLVMDHSCASTSIDICQYWYWTYVINANTGTGMPIPVLDKCATIPIPVQV
jgi:hypothetical protein